MGILVCDIIDEIIKRFNKLNMFDYTEPDDPRLNSCYVIVDKCTFIYINGIYQYCTYIGVFKITDPERYIRDPTPEEIAYKSYDYAYGHISNDYITLGRYNLVDIDGLEIDNLNIDGVLDIIKTTLEKEGYDV